MGSMEKIELKNMAAKAEEEEAFFNFPTLPYVCQRRFAEICDSQTLKTFASINSENLKLCKRCHIIENVDINYDSFMYKYRVLCFCKENEFCNGVDNIIQLTEKVEVRNSLTIKKQIGNERLDVNLLQKLSISIESIKDLNLEFYNIDLDDLKIITSSIKSKYMSFLGGIKSDSKENFVKYIKDLSKNVGKFEFTCKVNNAWTFSNGFVNEFEMLKLQKIITKLSIEPNHPYFPNNTILYLSKE